MQFVFPNKLALRARIPVSLEHAFRKMDVNLVNHSESLNSLSCNFVESICWKICRKTRVSCFQSPSNPSKLHLIYQNAQRKSVEEALEELERHLPVEIEENNEKDEVSHTLLIKAFESGMISALLDQGWISLENGVLINGNVALMEEGAQLEAISVAVHLEADDHMVFVVAPDILCYHRIKIKDFLPIKMEQRFNNGYEVNLENWIWNLGTDSGLNKIRCFVLPSLIEGYMIGLSKLSPQNKDFQDSEQLLLHKNGLERAKDCFYVNVQFTSAEKIYNAWIPSNLVFKVSGLMPAVHTIRASKAISALDNFTKSIAAWNFFDGGTIRFQGTDKINSTLETCTWITAKDTLQPHWLNDDHKDNACTLDGCTICSSTAIISSIDFRRSKPLSPRIVSKSEYVQDSVQIQEKQFCIHPTLKTKSKNIAKIIPHFTNRKTVLAKNMSSEKVLETDKCIPEAIPTEGRQYLLQVPSFAKRKPSAAVTHITKSESHHNSFGRRSKDEMGGTASSTRIQKGSNASKKKPSDMKATPFCVQVPGKESDGSSSIRKKDLCKGEPSKKKMSEPTGNPNEKPKPSGHRPKALKSQNEQKPQASMEGSMVVSQQTVKVGSKTILQAAIAASNVLDESINRNTPVLVTAPEKKLKRKNPFGTKDEHHAPKVNSNGEELECPVKKQKPEHEGKSVQIISTLQDESGKADVIPNPNFGAIPNVEVKPTNTNKRNNSVLDPVAIDKKVRDCYSEDKLKSLTVPELKCFLGANKAKVGGRKEELIQRVTSLLSN